MAGIAAIVLAAGRSSRFSAAGGVEASKLIAEFQGRAIVRAVAEAALGSRARAVVAVTGHARSDVEAALAGLPLTFTFNPDFATGLASSLKAGLAAAPRDAPGAIILLGDMPGIRPEAIDKILMAFENNPAALAVVPTYAGRRGNPVLLGRALFARVNKLEGDEGARRLLTAADASRIAEIPFVDESVTLDIDTPADLKAARKLL
jgi:molybdenum cofactor cytidylyltransferase